MTRALESWFSYMESAASAAYPRRLRRTATAFNYA